VKLNVVVKPNARKNAVETREDGSLVVYVSTPAIEGRANERLVEVLAEHFGRPRRDIVIVSGLRGKRKIVEVR
jgi:uncharacterized protein (TIGR00251 family)